MPDAPASVHGPGGGEAPLLVKTGSFLVDRKLALEKLMRFQLPDARLYVLALVRCAVAGGATRVSFSVPRGGGVEAAFDGEPFSAQDFEYPYAALFQETTAASRRGRELATALLSLLRLGPEHITIRSGRGGGRSMVRIESLESETVQPADDGLALTILRAVPRPGAPALLWGLDTANILRERCLLCPIPVEIDGVPIPAAYKGARPSEAADFQDGSLRGWVAIPERLRAPSEVSACRGGVLVEDIVERLPLAQVRCVLNDDDFGINASQTGVTRDERLERALSAAAAAVPALVRRAASVQTERMAHMGRYLDSPGLLRRWRELLEEAGGPPAAGLLGSLRRLASALPIPEKLSDLADAFPDDVRRTLWLREAAARRPGPDEPALPEEARRALWRAPLFIGCDLNPLSLDELKAQHERIGHVPYSEEPFADVSVGFRALWAYSPLELDHARRVFGDTLTDVTALLEQARRGGPAASGEAEPAPSFEAVGFGFADIFVREPFRRGAIQGEVALAAGPSKTGARAYLFVGGVLANSFDMGGDRAYLAVLSGTCDPTQVEALVESAVLRLYRKAGREYSPGSGAERDAALLRHLLGFLAWAKASPDRLAREGWILSVPLFPQPSGVRTPAEVQGALEAGQTLLFSSKDEPDFKSNPVFRDPMLTEELLRRLFPDCSAARFPGRDGLLFLFRKSAALPEGCLLEGRIGESTVALAPGEGADGRAVRAPWGVARVFGCDAPPALPDEAGAALLLAVLREHGALPDPGELRPLRRFILDAARRFAAPWRGPAGSALRRQLPPWHRRLLEVLAAMPFFRCPGRRPKSLESLGALAESGRHILYVEEGSDRAEHALRARAGDAPVVDALAVDAEELSLLDALWPDGRVRPFGDDALLTLDRPSAEAPRASAAPTAPAAAPEAAREAPPLAFDEPMLYQELLEESGVRCLAGLPPSPVPGVTATVLQGGKSLRAVVRTLGSPLAGSLLADASRYGGPAAAEGGLAPDLEKVLAAVYRRFLSDLVERWPSLDPATAKTDELSAYLLLPLVARPPLGPAGPEWDELRRKIRGLAMFRSAAGQPVSLEELERRACADGFLAHLPSKPSGLPDTAGFVAILPHPQLVSVILGVPMRKFAYLQPGQARPAARRPAADRPLESRLADLFADLRGSRGLNHSRCPAPETVKFVPGPAADMLPRFSDGSWEISSAYPLVASVLGSGLDPEVQAEYLVSLAFSEANRRLNNITDAEDIAFQEALANRLVQDL